MNNYYNTSNQTNQSTQEPTLVRMLHPTSGRQGYNEVINQTAFPSQLSIDPRLAATINMQTQQAIAASSMSTGVPYQEFVIPEPFYYVQQPYPFFPVRR